MQEQKLFERAMAHVLHHKQNNTTRAGVVWCVGKGKKWGAVNNEPRRHNTAGKKGKAMGQPKPTGVV